MPWHVSRSNPLKVYDSYHVEACMASTPEMAGFIMRAANGALANGATFPMRLSEPARPEPPVQEMNIVDEDSCCGPRLVRELRVKNPGENWFCPKCGCEWRVKPESGVRRWSPVIEVSVIPSRTRFP